MSLLESLRQDKYAEGSQRPEGIGSQARIYSSLQWDCGGETLRILVPFSSVLGVLCGVMNLDKGPEDMICLLFSGFECHVIFTF